MGRRHLERLVDDSSGPFDKFMALKPCTTSDRNLDGGIADGRADRGSSGTFAKSSEMFAYGLDERLPVPAFYEGLEHIYRLTIELRGARGR